jgi:hypothetical protein
MAILSDVPGNSDGSDNEPGEGTHSRLPLIAGAAAIVFLVVIGAWWMMRPGPARPQPASDATAKTEAPVARPTSPAEMPAEPAAPGRATPRRERAPKDKPAVTTPVEEPAAPAGPTLAVDSDVPGASVFLNRKYLGTTPLRTADVTPGSGQLNVSAEGYDGVARTIEVGESGVTEVTVRLKEVRLDVSVPVVHKHAMGSCEGTLRASVSGLRYDTSNKGDAFTLGFAEVETFELDYLQKALKVKRRGGRTWNFTTKAVNADPLFVFHRDVEKARAKLAAR